MIWRLSNRGKQSIDLAMYSDTSKQGEVSRRDETGEQAHAGCDSAITGSHDGCKPASHFPLFFCAEDDRSCPIGKSRGDMREDLNPRCRRLTNPLRSLCAFRWLDTRLHVHNSTSPTALTENPTTPFSCYALSTQWR
jgi:hypothetical protein